MGRPRKNAVAKAEPKVKASKAIKKLEKAVKTKLKEVKNLGKEKKEKTVDILQQFIDMSENEYATIVFDGTTADVAGFLDTGSLSFNALLSGKMKNGGIPGNKITILAGESSTGKTFFVLAIIKKFLENFPKGRVVFFESESAVSKQMVEERMLDSKRIAMFPVETVQQVRTQAVKFLNSYIESGSEIPLLFILDSLGNLSTTKEIEDTASGKETADMTRARLIKSLFRVVTLKLGKAKLPFLITNHTYDEQGPFGQQVMSGGSGASYNSSATVFISGRKDKDGNDVIGKIMRCTLKKGRLTRENKQVEVALTYDKGLRPYYGLLDIAAKYDIIKRSGKVKTAGVDAGKQKGKVEFPGMDPVFESTVNENPERFFTPEIMEKLELACAKEFLYGSANPDHEEDEILGDEEETAEVTV